MCPGQRNGSHLDVIKYEIDMLRFCLEKLKQEPVAWESRDKSVYTEGGWPGSRGVRDPGGRNGSA